MLVCHTNLNCKKEGSFFMSFVPFFLQDASAAGNEAVGMGGTFGMLIPLVLVMLIMYFFMIRPQNKKQKETEAMISALKKGDKVVTIGGIHGVVSSTKDSTVILKVDDGTKIEFNKTAIATVVVDKPAENATEKSKPAKKSIFAFNKKSVAEEIKESESENKDSDSESEEHKDE